MPAVSLTSPRLLPGSGDVLTSGVPQLTSPMSTSTSVTMCDTKPTVGHKREDSLTTFVNHGNFGTGGINSLQATHATSGSQSSVLRTNQLTNDQGLSQSPPTSRSLFAVNGVSGSGLSSAVSSRSPSTRSSFSNLQHLGETSGIEYGNKIGMENRNRTSDQSPSLDSLVKVCGTSEYRHT